MSSHLTNIQRDIIAHRHVCGATVEQLANEFGRTTDSMQQMLRSPGMQERMQGWSGQVRAQAERARAYVQDKAVQLAEQLLDDARDPDGRVRAWALPLALQAAGVVVKEPRTIKYEGNGTVRHEHTHTGEVEVSGGAPRSSPVVDALREIAEQMRDRYAIDVTSSPHVLTGEAARPRPEGYAAVQQRQLAAEPTFSSPARPTYAVNPDDERRQGY